jgi:TM2 domain-containing membrane protein YozV
LPTAAGPHSDPFRSQNANPDVREFASNKIAAGVCGILLGGLGVHKFILGLNTPAIIMLAVWLTGLITGMCIIIPLLACIAMQTIGLVEGIIYLTKTDEEFYRLYAIEKKEWF